MSDRLLQTFKNGGKESDTITASMLEHPYLKTSQSIIGDDIKTKIKILRITDSIKKRKKRLVFLQQEIEDFIENIEDSEMRLIIRLKYIDGLTWLQTSTQVYGYPCEGKPRKRIERFFKQNQYI